MKILCIQIFTALFVRLASSAHVICEYSFSEFEVLPETYYCNVQNSLFINSENNATIDKIDGNHKINKTNELVKGFWAEYCAIEFFPRDLQKFFKNLKVIGIINGLKKIQQANLKPFKELEMLSLQENDIEILEQDLFKYNRQLKYISFYNNKIKHIHPDVFVGLNRLIYLNLEINVCIDMVGDLYSKDSKSLLRIIKEIKIKCQEQQETKKKDETKVEQKPNNSTTTKTIATTANITVDVTTAGPKK